MEGYRHGVWNTRVTVTERIEAPDADNAARILSSRLTANGFTIEPSTAVAIGAYEYPEYEVEVQRTVTTTVTTRAKNPLSAAKQADTVGFPLPSTGEWDAIDGWTYIVREKNGSGEILYEGNAQELE
jgi:threonine synthase